MFFGVSIEFLNVRKITSFVCSLRFPMFNAGRTVEKEAIPADKRCEISQGKYWTSYQKSYHGEGSDRWLSCKPQAVGCGARASCLSGVFCAGSGFFGSEPVCNVRF